MPEHLNIAMIAGEPSGDFLGAQLIQSMQVINPNINFYGIGGPLMRAQGLKAIYPMEKIAVMGVSDVLRSYPRLKWIHTQISRYLLNHPPHLFFGIDAPDFNLPIEICLRQKGIKTAHYVSPKVWAWRSERVHQVKKAVDLLLSVFPFEVDFYKSYAVPIQYVGHPLADVIPLLADTAAIKKKWGYEQGAPIIAVLPGSRQGEIKHIGPLFIEVMQLIQLACPEMNFMVPLANGALRNQFENQLKNKGYALKLKLIDGSSREVMTAADLVLTKAGTSTLEAALLKKPMIVSFKMSQLTYSIVAPKVNVIYTSLPNLLANKPLVPEFIQQEACPNKIAQAALELLKNTGRRLYLEEQFTTIHHALKHHASQQSANALFGLI